jgi:DNA-directed RNA polymerase subunit D
MKVELIKSKDNVKRIAISGVKPSFANTLRRACSFEVPVLAIEDVYFTKNSSALYDEIVSHRLALVALKTDLKSYEVIDKCSCKAKGCAKCQVVLKLSVTGPAMVRAKDLKSQDPAIKPLYPNTPIVELIDGQEIEFEAVAVLGKGKTHAKWSSCLSYYHKYPTSKIKGDVAKALKDVPQGLFDKKGNIIDLSKYDLCKYYAEKSNGAITINTTDDKFVFTIEPWGQLDSKQILVEASNIIKQKLKDVKI